MNNNNGVKPTGNPFLSQKSHIGGFAYSLAAILFLVFSFFIGLILGGTGLAKGSDAYIYLSYLAAPLAISTCILITFRFKKVRFFSVFPVKCKPKYFLIAILLIYGMQFALSWLNAGMTSLFELMGYIPRPADSYMPNVSGGLIVPVLLVIALLPAVLEEALFRGVILNTAEESMGTIRTIFIVGFAFALFHASPEQTVYQFIAGCVFAFVAVRSHSLLPCVLMHFINNAVIIIFNACGLLDAAGNLAVSADANIALIITGAFSFVGGLLWLILDRTKLKKCTKGGVVAFFVYASVGILALAVVWVLSFF